MDAVFSDAGNCFYFTAIKEKNIRNKLSSQ